MNWIVVTGDTGATGLEICRRLLEESEFGVIGVGRRSSEAVEARVAAHSGRYRRVIARLDRPEEVKSLYLDGIRPIGPVHGLVNNAAVAYDDLLTNARAESLRDMFAVNVLTTILMTKYAVRNMLLHETGGSIVHVSSVAAATGYAGLSMYAATKGALESFSRGVAREWGSRGIRSNCVAPGFMTTPMSQGLSPEQLERIVRRTAIRKETEISSVSAAVLYLLSPGSSSVTGTVLHVDAGAR